MVSKPSVLVKCTSTGWLTFKVYFHMSSPTSRATRYSSQQCHWVSSQAPAILTAEKWPPVRQSEASAGSVAALLCWRRTPHPKQRSQPKAALGPTAPAKTCGACRYLSWESCPFTRPRSNSKHKLNQCTLFLPPPPTPSDVLGYNLDIYFRMQMSLYNDQKQFKVSVNYDLSWFFDSSSWTENNSRFICYPSPCTF